MGFGNDPSDETATSSLVSPDTLRTPKLMPEANRTARHLGRRPIPQRYGREERGHVRNAGVKVEFAVVRNPQRIGAGRAGVILQRVRRRIVDIRAIGRRDLNNPVAADVRRPAGGPQDVLPTAAASPSRPSPSASKLGCSCRVQWSFPLSSEAAALRASRRANRHRQTRDRSPARQCQGPRPGKTLSYRSCDRRYR